MKLKQVNTAFIVMTGVSVIVFMYLVFLGYDEMRSLKDIIKIVASIIFPIPLLFFVRVILIENFLPENTDAYKLKNQKPAITLLMLTLASGIIILKSIEWMTGQQLENHLVIAHLINSTTISSYVLNYMMYNNLKVNGVLSGLLLSLAIYIFFLSA